MKVFTDYLWFTTKQRQEFVRITDEVAAVVKKSGVQDGMVLVSAMDGRVTRASQARRILCSSPVYRGSSRMQSRNG